MPSTGGGSPRPSRRADGLAELGGDRRGTRGEWSARQRIADRHADLLRARALLDELVRAQQEAFDRLVEAGDAGEEHHRTPRRGVAEHLDRAVFSEANVEERKVSVLAPLGTAVLGYRAGDVIEWEVPAGTRRLKVERVLFQPEASASKAG